MMLKDIHSLAEHQTLTRMNRLLNLGVVVRSADISHRVVEARTGEQLLGRAPELRLGLGGEARCVGDHVVPGGVEVGHGLGHSDHGVQSSAHSWSLASSHQGTRVRGLGRGGG